MLLSVIIPVYNRVDELERCLISLEPIALLRDTVEVIVVDDGSNDDQREETGRLAARYGARHLVLCHRGASAARNAGAAVAAGRFLWFVDSDDTVNDDSLAPLLKKLRSLPEGCQILVTSTPSTLSKAPVKTTFPTYTNHTLCFICRRWLMEHPELLYPEDMSVMEDTVFILRLVFSAERVAYDESIHPYCIHKSPVSTTSGAWSDERSHRFIGDICHFFEFLKEFSIHHSPFTIHNSQFSILNLKSCYRFVYLRTLAVKGCPWSDIKKLRATVELTDPYIFFERLLFFAPFHRTLAFICRTIRKRR